MAAAAALVREDKLMVFHPQVHPVAPGSEVDQRRNGIRKALGVHLRGFVRHVYVERWVKMLC